MYVSIRYHFSVANHEQCIVNDDHPPTSGHSTTYSRIELSCKLCEGEIVKGQVLVTFAR
jgi:hypothetical protein